MRRGGQVDTYLTISQHARVPTCVLLFTFLKCLQPTQTAVLWGIPTQNKCISQKIFPRNMGFFHLECIPVFFAFSLLSKIQSAYLGTKIITITNVDLSYSDGASFLIQIILILVPKSPFRLGILFVLSPPSCAQKYLTRQDEQLFQHNTPVLFT